MALGAAAADPPPPPLFAEEGRTPELVPSPRSPLRARAISARARATLGERVTALRAIPSVVVVPAPVLARFEAPAPEGETDGCLGRLEAEGGGGGGGALPPGGVGCWGTRLRRWRVSEEEEEKRRPFFFDAFLFSSSSLSLCFRSSSISNSRRCRS